MNTISRVFVPATSSYFLFGPRGSGKSTWLRNIYPDSFWIDLLDPEMFRLYSARPERLCDIVRGKQSENKRYIIDEIQLVPQLLRAVHLLVEEDSRRQFILTGSSSRKLKRSGVDLLAGRAVIKTMHPFLACELGKAFDLESALGIGLVPLIVTADNFREKQRTYVALYLQEEVRQEGIVRNVGDFARFLEVISFSHGTELNTSNIARECAVGRKAVEAYVEIIKDLLLAFTVPAFVKKAERARRAHPKFYLFDTGIYRSLRPSGPMDRPEEIGGAALEGLVAQHLRAWLLYRESDDNLYYWRTYDGAEVDFVMYGPENFIAFEIKNSLRIRPEDLRGLRSFGKKYPQARRVVLYRGREHLIQDDIVCLPVQQFLLSLHPSRTITL
jgi:predicted AAA+ superfamily ATPase